jgi:ATP-dependent RNA helicase DDX42
LYEEHEAITSMSDADVNSMRRQFDMNVTGFGVPKPCVSFAHFGFDDSLISIIARQEFSEPTGIQRQAIPAALSGRDVIVRTYSS